MSRSTTKSELIESATAQFEKLQHLLHSMSNEMQNAAFNFDDNTQQKEAHWKRDLNLRDVLIHLFEWHQLLLNWINSNQKGISAPFLPAPYNWKTYGQMNVKFWEKHQNTTYAASIKMLAKSHAAVMKLIENFSNEELFTKKFFAWTGTSTLGSYCVSATASHYDWAMKKIKRHIKSYF